MQLEDSKDGLGKKSKICKRNEISILDSRRRQKKWLIIKCNA